MEYLHNHITLETPTGTFPITTDSMLLSAFAKLPAKAKVLDLGSGCGTLGLLLCANHPDCHVTGVEIDSCAHQGALDNIRRNSLSDRLTSICADLRAIPTLFPAGSFSCCVSNPPYYTGGPASKACPQARRDDSCTTKELFDCAAWALRYGGKFYVVQKPERLAELCACGVNAGLEPKKLCLVRHRPDKEIALVLLACKKGARPGLTVEELSLTDVHGNPTDTYRKIYHIEE